MDELKKCPACKTQLMLSAFYKNRAKKDGLQQQCKGCEKEYRKENKDKIVEYSKEYCKTNAAKYNTRSAKRRASKLNATPSWLTKEDFEQIK